MKNEFTNSGKHPDDTASAVRCPSWREEMRQSRVFEKKLRELLLKPDIADLVVPPMGKHREAALRALAEVPPNELATVLPYLKGNTSSDQGSLDSSEDVQSDGGPTKKTHCRPGIMLKPLKLLNDPKINEEFCCPVENLLKGVQARIDPALKSFLLLPDHPEAQPDTTTWKDFYRDLYVKQAWNELSPKEFAAYEALSRWWRRTAVFEDAPRAVQLSAHLMILAQNGTEDPPLNPEFESWLKKEMRVYALAPHHQETREQLRNKRKITANPDDDDVSVSMRPEDLPLKPGELLEWPQRTKNGAVTTCLQSRAVIGLVALTLNCHRRGDTKYLLTQADLNRHINRINSVTGILTDYLSPSTRDECTSANISTGRTKRKSQSALEDSLKKLQIKMVERFLEAHDNEYQWKLSEEDHRTLDLEPTTITTYVITIKKAPWFRRMLEFSTDLSPESPSPAPQPSPSPAHSPELTAHGCRYRDEFFDSREEATVAILLERYITSFWVNRGESFQIPVDSKRIDFFVGEHSGSRVYLEYHPIILGSWNNLHDFESRDEYLDYLIEKRGGSAEIDPQWKDRLAVRYAAERLALAQKQSPNARLLHVQNREELRGELMKFLRREIPEKYFNKHFDDAYTALGELQRAEELLHDELDRRYGGDLYRREWNSAEANQISRPVRSNTWAPRVLTSFAHRSRPRAVEIVVPELFGHLINHGRADDEFYASQDTLVATLKRDGYETLCIPAQYVTESSARAIAQQVVAFLTEGENLEQDEAVSLSAEWGFPLPSRPSLRDFPFTSSPSPLRFP